MLVPLSEEMSYIHLYVSSHGGRCDQAFEPKIATYPFSFRYSSSTECDVDFYVIGDMGNLRTATRITQILLDETYDYIFLVGLAGSLDHSIMRLGDVVVSNRVKSYYPDKVAEISFAKNEEFITPGDPRTLNDEGFILIDRRKKILSRSYLRYRRDAIVWEESSRTIASYLNFLETKLGHEALTALRPVTAEEFPHIGAGRENVQPRARYGTIFSSEMVIDSYEYIQFLMDKDTDESLDIYSRKYGGIDNPRRSWFPGPPIAVDMETYGFFSITRRLRSEIENARCLSVRGISDLASAKSDLDEATGDRVRRLAVENCIAIVMSIISVVDPNTIRGGR